MPAYNAGKTSLQDDHKIHTPRTSPDVHRDGAGFRSLNLCGGLDCKVEEFHLCIYPRVCQCDTIHSIWKQSFSMGSYTALYAVVL